MRYFPPTNIYLILKEHGFFLSDYTTQFPSFWKKNVCFRCLKILHISKKKSCNQVSTSSSEHQCAYPLCLISWNGPSRSQGSLFPSAFPGDPQAALYSTAALSLSAALPLGCDFLGTTLAHLAQGSLCPCGGPLSPHATSLSDGVGPHFTPMKSLCEMALGKDVIYLSIPSLWVILLCLPPIWHACFVNFLTIGLSLTPNTLLPFQLPCCSFLDSAFSSILD